MSQNDLDDFFTGTFEKRPPAASWGKIQAGDRYVKGAWEGGTILKISTEQKFKWLNGKPIEALVWNDGTKRMQGVVVIQTTKVGVLSPEDDGRRTFYIDGKMKAAVGEAIKEVGAPGLREGGKLAIQNTGMVKEGEYLVYTWEAKYEAPPPAADQFFDEGEPVVSQEQKVLDKVRESRTAGLSTLESIQRSGHAASLRPDEQPPF